MKAFRRIAFLALIILLVATACGGEDKDATVTAISATLLAPTETSEPTETAPPPPPTNTPPPTAEPPAPTEPPAIEAPLVGQVGEGEGRREDIPLMPDASNITSVGPQVSYQTASPVTAVADFYKTEMPKHGWTADPMIAIVTDFAASLAFHKGAETATVTIAPSGTGGSQVTIGVQ